MKKKIKRLVKACHKLARYLGNTPTSYYYKDVNIPLYIPAILDAVNSLPEKLKERVM